MKPAVTTDFFDALALLSNADQKRVRRTLTQVVGGYEGAGLRLHKINHPSGAISSYSVTRDLRIIAHFDGNVITLLFVGHHDDAYQWVNRRKFVQTGDAIRILVSREEEAQDAEASLVNAAKGAVGSAQLEGLRSQIESAADDNEALDLIAACDLASTIKDELLEELVSRGSCYRFEPPGSVSVLEDDAALEDALRYPLDKWRVFLHPRQQEIVALPQQESVVITGGPGTGKSVCVVHRIRAITSELSEEDVVVLTTYKAALLEYIVEMLRKLGVSDDKVVVEDISSLKIVAESGTDARLHGFFEISGEQLFYHIHGKRRRVAHLFFDEYQDFRQGQLTAIRSLTEVAPFTIALDYTQAIYRPPRGAVEDLLLGKALQEHVNLTYCYRLNDQIVTRLKQVVSVIKVLSTQGSGGNVAMLESEEPLIRDMRAAVSGPPPLLVAYSDADHRDQLIRKSLRSLRGRYEPDEVVVSVFFDDLFRHLSEDCKFRQHEVPSDSRMFYRYVGSLKGQEFKAGVIVFDECIGTVLNMNYGLFRKPSGPLGSEGNLRLYLNMVYVAVSRFRDHLTILYPERTAAVIEPIFG